MRRNSLVSIGVSMTAIAVVMGVILTFCSKPASSMPPGTWIDAKTTEEISAWTRSASQRLIKQHGFLRLKKEIDDNVITCWFTLDKHGQAVKVRSFEEPGHAKLTCTTYPTEFIKLASPFKELPSRAKDKQVVVTFSSANSPQISLEDSRWTPFPVARWP
jgi:hypothetical protein